MSKATRVLQLLRPYSRYLAQSLIVSMMMTVLALPGPYITKLLLDDAYPHRDYGLLQFLLIGGAGFALFLAVVQAVASLFGRQVSLAMGLDVQSRLLHHVQRLDFGFFDQHETGDLLSRFDDLDASISGVIQIINTVVINSLQLLIFPAVLIWIHPTLAALTMLVLPFDAVLALLAGYYGRRYGRWIAEGSATLSARTVEALTAIRSIQSLNAEALFYRKVRGAFEGLADLQVRAAGIETAIGFAATVVRTAGALAFGWYGWTQVLDGEMTPGTFLAFSAYAGFLYGPVHEIITLWPQVQGVRVHVDRFLEVYDRRPLVDTRPHAIMPTCRPGDIEFNDVVFGYTDRPVLTGVTTVFRAGRRTVLTGRSGAGKSTLVKLIPRFYDPSSGIVRLHGRDLRSYDLPALRRTIGFALQGGCLFYGTVRENLTLAGDIPQGDVESAAIQACIHRDIAALPDGYDTPLGESGGQLSAGQAQRLALARVLLLDTPVLILDEPTSALDEETERSVRDALHRVSEGRTTILITHRPETLALADDVVELVDGRVRSAHIVRGLPNAA